MADDYMLDSVAAGDTPLVDFTPSGVSPAGNLLSERNPGGAPANVMAMLSKLGMRTAFIGKVGLDEFGLFLKQTLYDASVETKGLVMAENSNTTLAFVHLKADGDRFFRFYRNPGADLLLNKDEVDYELIGQSRWFHFGSVSMTGEPSRSATLAAVKYAKSRGLLVSYDPNPRLSLWNSLAEARKYILDGMKYADVLKISEEELDLLMEGSDLSEGSRRISDLYGIRMIFVTLGSRGCFYRFGQETGEIKGYQVNTIDATGADDAFLGALLYQLMTCQTGLGQLNKAEIEAFIAFANAAGALATTRRGAIPSLPNKSHIEALVRGSSRT